MTTKPDKLFVLFKLPRTGSQRLFRYLNGVEGLRCFHEILNRVDSVPKFRQVADRLVAAAEANSCVGFSLNPFSRDIDLLDVSAVCGSRTRGFALSLTRGDILAQSISLWVSRKMGAWPRDNEGRSVDTVHRFVATGGVHVPAEEFRPIARRLMNESASLCRLARDFARRHGFAHVDMRYEGLYLDPFEDLLRLESMLGIEVDRGLVAPEAKVLPPAVDWVVNHDELHRLTERLGRSLQQ